MHLFCLLAARLAARADAERGDVPGWVLITGMTVALASVRLMELNYHCFSSSIMSAARLLPAKHQWTGSVR